MRKVLCLLLIGAAFWGGSSSCTKKLVNDPVADSIYLGSIPFVMNNNATFSDFYAALQQTGWVDTLYDTGPYTVLLPNNDAYAGYYGNFTQQAGGLADYEAAEVRDGLTLSASVGYDLLKGRISLRSLPLGMNQEVLSVTGRTHYITRYLDAAGDTLSAVDGQPVISVDNPATNGLIQVVAGAVPYPNPYPTVLQQIQNDTNLTFFAAALQRAHLDTLLKGAGPFTVLAPVNGSFTNAYFSGGYNLGVNMSCLDSVLAADPVKLTNLLKYYILPGRFFLHDFIRQLANPTDTLPLTMLDGNVVKFTMSYYPYGSLPFLSQEMGTGTLQPTFAGNGNLLNGIYLAGIDDEYFFTTNSYNKDGADLTAQNGIVHTIEGALIQ
ncbi:MAG TPA: fasciclin domain-containing protein [Dinghuibacter sp.]|uniref:fasciclin domain-containing protein n=1 Tax=Dinghuibacter sp. TaxID=2024697 RepID=UPI002C2CA86B|nr:fasciclin domain-containing protein [Dinghuibacter sp.]HTJ14265.1 fasciclin domain-containing protein [Dinghuibacter sp.]